MNSLMTIGHTEKPAQGQTAAYWSIISCEFNRDPSLGLRNM